MLNTEQAGGIQSPFFQIKETYSLPGFLGTDTVISQTPAFSSLQMGSTSHLGAQTECSWKAPWKKLSMAGQTHTGLWIPLSSFPRSPWQICRTKSLSKNAAISAIHYHGSKPLGRKRRQRELGRICLQWGLETRDTPDWADWLDVVWPRSKGMDRMTFTGLRQPGGSMKRDFWFTFRVTVHKWLWNIPKQLPRQ